MQEEKVQAMIEAYWKAYETGDTNVPNIGKALRDAVDRCSFDYQHKRLQKISSNASTLHQYVEERNRYLQHAEPNESHVKGYAEEIETRTKALNEEIQKLNTEFGVEFRIERDGTIDREPYLKVMNQMIKINMSKIARLHVLIENFQ